MIDGPSVCVITAATGHPAMTQCLDSVANQTYANLQHVVVIDGHERRPTASRSLAAAKPMARRETMVIPWITGANDWCGHRIYGATPILVQTDYVAWLDEDNWFDPDHIERLVTAITAVAGRWTFSLRRIVRADGSVACEDNCESLGTLHSTFLDTADFHVDTSCFLLRRDIAVSLAGAWNRSAVTLTHRRDGPDRLLTRSLISQFPGAPCSGGYTLNYRVGNRGISPREDYFHRGNQVMRLRYPEGLPWATLCR